MIYYDYDEFNIYTTLEDVQDYIEMLFTKGFESKDEIYKMCVERFGLSYLIDEIFNGSSAIDGESY